MAVRGTGRGAAAIFKLFADAINQHDVDRLTQLMAEDHLFIDAAGNHTHGIQSMRAAWRGYFEMCPDYSIQVDICMEKSGVVLGAGSAGGTIDNTSWRIPAAWLAVVRSGSVLEWRVFADNKPVYEILAKRETH